jgi:hypothetical protein
MQDTQGMVYAFPALTECREAFAKLLQQKVTWAEKATWSPEPVPDPEPRGMP